jgi:peptide/nickel transport system substrate-binding protein
MLLVLAAACGETKTIEVPGETVVVTKEVIKEVQVPGETVVKTIEVPGETVVVTKEVIKTIEVPGQTVIKEVQVPGETIVVTKEVVKVVAGPEKIVVREVLVQVPGKKYVTDPTTGRVIPAPEYGGTIVRLGQHEPPHTDTYFTHHAAAATDGVTESLAHADWGIDRSVFDHMKRPTPLWVLKGQLASGWVLNDPLTITMNIRDDVYWHNKAPMNGRKLTAQDVAWNWQRYLHLGHAADEGEEACCAFKSVKWESVEATDDTTVVFKLLEPNIDTLNILFTSYSPHILPPEVIQEHGDLQDWRNLVGTGPYMLTDWVEGSSLTWEKNPDYWGTDEKFPENQLPYADFTKVLIMKDEATRVAALRVGKADYMGWLSDSALSTVEQAEALRKTNPEIVLIPYAYRSTTSPAFNLDHKPFDQLEVRRAMQMALDLETVNTVYLKGWGTVTPMGQIGTGAVEYSTPFNEWPEEVRAGYMYNPEGAIALLDAAGFMPDKDGVRIRATALFHGGSDFGLADIYADYWSKIGVDVEIRKAADSASWNSGIRDHTYEEDMIGGAIMGYDRNPVVIMRAFIHSEGTYNYTGLRDPAIDAMLEAAEDAATLEERQRLIKAMDQELSKQQYYVWGMKVQQFNVAQPWLIGYNGEYHLGLQQRYSQLFARMWLDQERKAQTVSE